MLLPMLITTKSFPPGWCVAGFCLFLLHFSAVFSCAALLHLNGNWSAPFGDNDGPWSLGQTYNFSISHDLTSAITASGNVRYTTAEQQGTDKITTLAPSLSFGISNDLFHFNLSGSQNNRQKGNEPSSISRSWNSNLSSNFTNHLWPQFRLSYGESNSTDDANPATIDSDSKNFAGNINYNWRFIKLLYNYRNDTNSDKINATENKTTGHSTNIQLTKNLLDNRLSLSASHQYSINRTEVSTSIIGGQLIVDLIASAAYAGIDNTPLTDSLPAVPALNDQDLLTATSAELPGIGDSLNLALQINLQSFRRLQLYFDRILTVTTQQRLHWSFYTSQDNVLWFPVATIPAISYMDENGRSIARVIFPAPLTSVRYIKAVVEADPGLDSAFFTEICAQEEINGSAGTVVNDYTSQNIQASINYRPWESFQLGYSFNRSISDSDLSALSTQDSHTLSSHLNLNRYFMLSLSLSENTDDIEEQKKNRNRSYSISYQATPLDTLSFSLNGTRNDHYDDNKKDRSTTSISTTLATAILPDLTANFSYQRSRSQNYIDGSDSGNNNYTFNLTARINPQLNLSYFYSYNETGTHNASLLFHPSELLSFTASAMLAEKIQSYSTSLHWRITRKIQTDLHYLVSSSDQEDTYGARFNLSWDISSYLSIRQSIDWNKSSTENKWSGLVSASYNF